MQLAVRNIASNNASSISEAPYVQLHNYSMQDKATSLLVIVVNAKKLSKCT